MPEYKSKSFDTSVTRTLSGQCTDILGELQSANGDWVPLPQIMRHAAQYNARLHTLRKIGYTIQNRTEVREGVRHSWYRIVNAETPSFAAPRVLQAEGNGVLFAPDPAHAQSLMLSYETGQRGDR